MGIRIDAYAIDVPAFNNFMEYTLAELLLLYQENGINPKDRLTFHEYLPETRSDDVYTCFPQGEITNYFSNNNERQNAELSFEDIKSIPFLQKKAKELTSNYQVDWILRAFSHCHDILFIEQLIDNHRQWWVGSVLQLAKISLKHNDYHKLELLFRKMLRGHGCRCEINEEDSGYNSDGLSMLIEEDSDILFGRWNFEECLSSTNLLTKIMSDTPVFLPPESYGIGPDESHWHEWAEENINSLLKIKELGYQECNVLTFIG